MKINVGPMRPDWTEMLACSCAWVKIRSHVYIRARRIRKFRICDSRSIFSLSVKNKGYRILVKHSGLVDSWLFCISRQDPWVMSTDIAHNHSGIL